MKNSGLFLLILVVAGGTIMYKFLPDGKVVVRPWNCFRDNCKRSAVPLMDVWGFMYRNTSSVNFFRRIAKSLRTLEHNVIRVALPKMTLTKCEYIQICEMMERWNVDISDLCRYSLMSIVKAHNTD